MVKNDFKALMIFVHLIPENFILHATNFTDNPIKMFTIGICDENLTEIAVRYQFDNLTNPFTIKLVKNIIEQQNWFHLIYRTDKIELGKFKRNKKSFILSLRSQFLMG